MIIPKYHAYPKEWGIQLRYTGLGVDLEDGDLELLDELREHFTDRQNTILSWKWDLAPLARKELPGIRGALLRLWKNGMVVRFTEQFFTKHDQRPEYINWYIWEIGNEESNIDRHGAGTAHYIVP